VLITLSPVVLGLSVSDVGRHLAVFNGTIMQTFSAICACRKGLHFTEEFNVLYAFDNFCVFLTGIPRQSKVLMSYLLPSRASELLAMNRSRLRVAVGLLTGHTKLRAHLYKLGHTEG
jgi:hypothetical protein